MCARCRRRKGCRNMSITEARYRPEPGEKGGWAVVRVNDAAHLD